ncbi:MAG TPA: NAD(P)-binding domain-containing protein [Pirellulales bacterium]|nr:NAD(P)-binding domain-containing protein [Pirellulales bacterium]
MIAETPLDRTSKYCVVGAGSSGLAVAKWLAACGVEFECLEREDDVGGNWCYGKPHSSIYRSTHLISSKPLTEYVDFPMPAEYPDYPSHAQVWEYFRGYARHFALYPRIEFRTSVERIEPATDAGPQGPYWDVTIERLAAGAGPRREVRRYRGVMIANGHNWDPKWPEFPGSFEGLSLHSAEYKTPDVLRGRRVLVVGGGNSGCDIAVEAAQNAERTFHSVRRGYHYLPKYIRGKPADQAGERLLRWRLPLALRRAIAGAAIRWTLGPPERFGLPKPDHLLFESHPIINSQMLYYVGHGQISPKPDVAELCGDRVRFVDGTTEAIDVIVYATGFKISFPFIDREHLNWRGGRPELFLNVFHPQHDNLAVAGLIQPDSGQFGLVDRQAELIARFLAALDGDRASAERFRRKKARLPDDLGRGIRYLNSSRHLLEVEHFSYRRRLEKLIASF